MSRMGSQQRVSLCTAVELVEVVRRPKGRRGVGIAHQGVDLAGIREGWTGCEVHQCSTHKDATKLEGGIEWGFLCGCVRFD